MESNSNNNNELFIKFVRGLNDVLKSMNQEMNAYVALIDVEKDCGKIIAKTTQLDADISRIFDYIDNFWEKEGLKNE